MVVLPSYIAAPKLTESIVILIRNEQKELYAEEIQTLESAKQVKTKRQICKFYPSLDNGILCLGGRLVHAKLPEESKCQKTNSSRQSPRTPSCIEFSSADIPWWD